ncbi:MAG: helix-turn-helix transcriptional regulator [Oscillospiraceae bacterium]|nr:helix-turn-helix transcriptional regulator [Oscillospiraceae bacterium]
MFYDKFNELCAEKKVKPGRACTEMGVSRSLAAKWKATGTEKPSADILEKMSKYFGKTIDEILDGKKRKAPTVSGEREVGYDDFTYAMQDEAKELTDADKQLLLSMARQLNATRRKQN